MKRFYKQAEAAACEGGHTVHLDGRPIRTPAKAPLVVPTPALADAIRDEWAAQGDKIDPDSMGFMTLAATTIDRVIPNHAAVAAEAAGYAGSDLLCYRAESPPELATRQAEAWDPVLDWARDRYDVTFTVTAGLMPVDQPEETRARFLTVAQGYDPFALTAVHVMTTACGSFLLALAIAEGRLSAEQGLDASRVDETYQEELWGLDDEAQARKERLRREVGQAAEFLRKAG